MKQKYKILNIFNFLKKDFLEKNDNFFKILDRNIKINKSMLGLNISVYNGKFYIPLKITDNMIGKTLGSFSFSHNIILVNKDNKYRFKKKNNKIKNKKK